MGFCAVVYCNSNTIIAMNSHGTNGLATPHLETTALDDHKTSMVEPNGVPVLFESHGCILSVCVFFNI